MTSRWDQFDNQFTSLRDAMGRLLDQSFTFGRGEGGEGQPQGAQTVPVNVFESEDVLMILVPMPGLQEEDIDITVRGNSLTVEGRERADLKPGSGKRYLRHEWRYGPYRRMVELPYAVDANSAEATFGNGVLTVRLQKAETERIRRIQVRSGSGAGDDAGARSGTISGMSQGGHAGGGTLGSQGTTGQSMGGMSQSSESRQGGQGSQGGETHIRPTEQVHHQNPGQSEQR